MQSAPARRDAGTMNTYSDDEFKIDSNRSTADRLYDAIYITRKLYVFINIIIITIHASIIIIFLNFPEQHNLLFLLPEFARKNI